MNRRSLIKRVWDKLFRRKRNISKRLVNDIVIMTPQYYGDYVKKYGQENWTILAQEFGRINKPKTDGNESKSV
jgi:hypothetical protein